MEGVSFQQAECSKVLCIYILTCQIVTSDVKGDELERSVDREGQ